MSSRRSRSSEIGAWPAALGTAVLDLLFPPRCHGCGAYGSAFCEACERSLLAPEPGDPPAGLAAAASAGIHDGPARTAVLALKHKGKLSLARPLGGVLHGILTDSKPGWPVDVIVPVPLHWFRQLQRGFNQSELLARELSRRAELPVDAAALTRVRWRPPQVGLSARERRENLRGAFAVRAPERITGRAVLLVDDVWTTGATLSECALTLRAAGAADVYGLTLTSGSDR